MSAFSAAVDTLNAALIDTFADIVQIVLPDGTTLMLNGVFSRHRVEVERNVATGFRYTLQVKTSDIANFNIDKSCRVGIGDAVYTIVDTLPDDGGMTAWTLVRYGRS